MTEKELIEMCEKHGTSCRDMRAALVGIDENITALIAELKGLAEQRNTLAARYVDTVETLRVTEEELEDRRREERARRRTLPPVPSIELT